MKRTPWIVVMRMLSKNPYNAFNINKTKHCNCLLSLESNIPSYSLKPYKSCMVCQAEYEFGALPGVLGI